MIKLLTTTQTYKEYTINHNFLVLQFLTHPEIRGFVYELPENLNEGEAYIIDNTASENHGSIAYIAGGITYIKPKNFMRAFTQNKEYIYKQNSWHEVNHD